MRVNEVVSIASRHFPVNQLSDTNENVVAGREDPVSGAEFAAGAGTKKPPDDAACGASSSPERR